MSNGLASRNTLYTRKSFYFYLKMGRTKLYTLAQKGNIPGSKVGSQWRFDREEIDAWIKSGQAAK
jgi:excisionase family DNA binding protein